ncbi:Glutathione S-transferase Mu 3 [Saguinus oedipus]|uniref:Glutathione S-transferase Mu 3 n=1 Tax=Saguinus oedipus TaxID=9490 RepID=A0ABQ9VI71_SAGOE|nr:Glutathione S-transferase Mu 3 [Saguinus oedipus]
MPSCATLLASTCGKTEEKIQVDISENQATDFCTQLIQRYYNTDHEKLKPQYLGQLPGQLKQCSMFLGEILMVCSGKLIFVDFPIYDVLDQNRMFESKCLDEFPQMKAFMCRLEVLEKTAAYM